MRPYDHLAKGPIPLMGETICPMSSLVGQRWVRLFVGPLDARLHILCEQTALVKADVTLPIVKYVLERRLVLTQLEDVQSGSHIDCALTS